MSPEIRRYLRIEISRLQKLRHECDIKLRQAWGMGCSRCGCPLEETSPGCLACRERMRGKGRRARARALVTA